MANRILVVLAAVAAGGFALAYATLRIEPHYENGSLAYVKIVPRGAAPVPKTAADADDVLPATGRPTLRVAVLNLDGMEEKRLRDARLAERLGRIISRFDLIGLTGLRGKDASGVVALVDAANAKTPGRYDFAVAPWPSAPGELVYSALVFDRAAVEVDRRSVRCLDDPTSRLTQSPLAAMLRARGPDPAEAFTFKLVCVRADPQRPAEELPALKEAFLAVRDDGSGEDDVIMLGDFGVDERNLGPLGAMLDVMPVLSGVPTTVRGTARTTTILFDRRAGGEFTGRAGVFDVIRELDLSIEAAEEISEHLPVWAEFSVYEGGRPGYVAGGTPDTAARQ